MKSKNVPAESDFYKKRFDSIQVLRGIAAVFVVAEHIRFLACGAFGVDIFFVISGFMIMRSTHRGREHFLTKRLIRILPFYYLVTFGVFGLLVCFPSMFEQTEASVIQLVKSLAFIPFDMGGGILQPILRIGWTINCEMFFYLLFWISMRISHRHRGGICICLLFLCVGAGTLLSDGAVLTGDMLPLLSETGSVSAWLAPVLFYGQPLMLEFGLGILGYYLALLLYEHCNRHFQSSTVLQGDVLQKTGSILILLLALACIALLALTAHRTNILGYRRLLVWGIPAFFIVLAFFWAGLSLKMPSFLVRLGDISFSLYLVHYYPIMLLDRKFFDFSTLRPLSVAGAVAGLCLVILLAVITHELIEVRLTRWLLKKVPGQTR